MFSERRETSQFRGLDCEDSVVRDVPIRVLSSVYIYTVLLLYYYYNNNNIIIIIIIMFVVQVHNASNCVTRTCKNRLDLLILTGIFTMMIDDRHLLWQVHIGLHCRQHSGHPSFIPVNIAVSSQTKA